MKHRISIKGKLAVAGCILAMGSINVPGYAFKVKCHYSSATSQPENTWKTEQELLVTVSVRNEQWQIQTDYGDGVIDSCGCNGTNVFRVLYDPTGPTNSLPGIITEDDYPADASPCVTVPWLVFCSSKRLARNIPTPVPWALARETPLAYLYRWEIQRFPTLPELPSHIKFVTDPDKEAKAASGVYLDREHLDKQARYLRSLDYVRIGARDRLGGEYTVLTSTNYSGIQIPLHVQVIFFDHLGQDKKVKSKPKIKYELVVDSILPLAETSDLLPPIQKRVDIVDHRLRDNAPPLDYASYQVINGSWPTEITRELQQALKQRRDREINIGMILRRAGYQRPIFIILTILFLILPLPIMAAVKRRNKNKQQQKGTSA